MTVRELTQWLINEGAQDVEVRDDGESPGVIRVRFSVDCNGCGLVDLLMRHLYWNAPAAVEFEVVCLNRYTGETTRQLFSDRVDALPQEYALIENMTLFPKSSDDVTDASCPRVVRFPDNFSISGTVSV